jgi:hypothetical protein
LLLIVSGLAIADSVNKKCITQNKCILLGVLAGGAALGAILLLEVYIAHRKARGTWVQTNKDNKILEKKTTGSQIWFRSILRIMLSSVLIGLPVVIQGAFVTTIFGLIAGFSLDTLVRVITNQIISAKKDES